MVVRPPGVLRLPRELESLVGRPSEALRLLRELESKIEILPLKMLPFENAAFENAAFENALGVRAGRSRRFLKERVNRGLNSIYPKLQIISHY